MKIYINNAKENWVVDRFILEWNIYNHKQKKSFLGNDTTIWLIAPWTWAKIPKRYLKKNKVICTIHHVDMDKFTKSEEKEFNFRDEYINFYHAISNNTAAQLKQLTDKPIKTIPFWVNQNLWSEIKDNKKLFNKYKLDNTKFLIGSFQRDTEGSDLISPKLSKGPDIFVNVVSKMYQQKIVDIVSSKINQI